MPADGLSEQLELVISVGNRDISISVPDGQSDLAEVIADLNAAIADVGAANTLYAVDNGGRVALGAIGGGAGAAPNRNGSRPMTRVEERGSKASICNSATSTRV